MNGMDDRLHAMLVALGPGGTRELAERALAHADSDRAELHQMIRDLQSGLTITGSARATVKELHEIITELEIGGLQEVAAELGMSRQKLGHLRSGRRAPRFDVEPKWQLSTGPVWVMDDIRQWNVLMNANQNG